MANELTIVGASVRAAAYSALRAGFRPYAIDQYADRDLSAVCRAVRVRRYPHDLLGAMRDGPHAPWIYTGGLENHPRLVDRLAEIRPLWGNSGDALRLVRNPWLLAETAREAGLKMPTTLRESSGRRCGKSWLKKPLRSSGGHQLVVAAPGDQPPRRGFYYQLFVPGPTYGAVFLAKDGFCQLLGVSRQLRGSDAYFAYQGSIVAPGAWHPNIPALVRLGLLLVERFGLRGLFNVDFISNDDGEWILEVNPRYSASVEVLERATGVSFLDLHAGVFDTSHVFPHVRLPTRLPSRAFGKAIVYAPNVAVVTSEMDDLVAEWNSDATWPGIADLPRVGDTIDARHPICTVFAEGDVATDVERQLQGRSGRVLHSLAAAGASGN